MNRTRFASPAWAAVGLLALSLAADTANAQEASPASRAGGASISHANTADAKPTIVLVHGAWADGTGWQHVIPLLERDGYTVIAVQNPLSSLADDIATTKRVIDAQKGPVVVAAHSYGGAVMTGAASGAANVKALVFFAAFAPDAGESIGAASAKFPATVGSTSFRPDAAGYLYIDRAKFHQFFCGDVPEAEARIMAAAQKPLNSAIFGQTLDNPAWKTIPSWYMVSQDDLMINPDQERFYAKRMHAKTSEIKASHVAVVSHPVEVTKLIEEAAHSVTVSAR
jgi:pimeloyl-ACP methyl ester carboxylesterase